MGKFLLFLLLLIIILILIILGIYKYQTSAVSSNTDPKIITVEEGDNYFSIASKLKEKNLIRSETFYKIYLKFANPNSLITGDYELNEAMSVQEIVKVLSDEDSGKTNTIKLTFREGLNITQMAKIVEEKTDITADESSIKLFNQSREYIRRNFNEYAEANYFSNEAVEMLRYVRHMNLLKYGVDNLQKALPEEDFMKWTKYMVEHMYDYSGWKNISRIRLRRTLKKYLTSVSGEANK